MDKTGEDGSGLHLDKFEKRRPTFFQIYGMTVYTCIKLSLTQLENHSQLLCGHDFANERLSLHTAGAREILIDQSGFRRLEKF